VGFRAIVAAAAAVVVAVIVLNACAPDDGLATSTPKGAVVTLPADAPVVAFYGDSYTLGTGASDPSKRWSTIICAQRGWREVNPSVNGLGFVRNRAAFGVDEPGMIVASHPDIVFITMGLNDNFAYVTGGDAPEQIHRAIVGDLVGLKQRLPAARFIVVEPFWYTDDRPHSLAVISGWVKAEAAAIGADYIPGASHWIEHHPEWMADDGLHPNDAGYAHMAVEMDAALTRLGL
jgi:lysophospholipase L1-like esterase